MSRAHRLIALAAGLGVAVSGVAAWLSTSTTSTATATATTIPGPPGTRVVVLDGSRLAFPGVDGWSEEPCSDVAAEDLCQSQWRHTGGQIARVLLLPLPDPGKLDAFATRLQQQVTAAGGVAEVVDGDKGAIRLLQPMRAADRADAVVVGITYVVPAPDRGALHLLTSTAPLAEQEPGDQRVRDLLAFGAWVHDDDDAPAAGLDGVPPAP